MIKDNLNRADDCWLNALTGVMWITWMGSLSSKPPRSRQGEGDKGGRLEGKFHRVWFLSFWPSFLSLLITLCSLKLFVETWQRGNITKLISSMLRNMSAAPTGYLWLFGTENKVECFHYDPNSLLSDIQAFRPTSWFNSELTFGTKWFRSF